MSFFLGGEQRSNSRSSPGCKPRPSFGDVNAADSLVGLVLFGEKTFFCCC